MLKNPAGLAKQGFSFPMMTSPRLANLDALRPWRHSWSYGSIPQVLCSPTHLKESPHWLADIIAWTVDFGRIGVVCFLISGFVIPFGFETGAPEPLKTLRRTTIFRLYRLTGCPVASDPR